MFEVEILNEAGYALDAERLRTAALTVLARHELEPNVEMAIAITDDDAVADLNRRFRGVDAPTDVLSFPMESMPISAAGEADMRYLGDLAIAYPYAKAQAEQAGHALDDSL